MLFSKVKIHQFVNANTKAISSLLLWLNHVGRSCNPRQVVVVIVTSNTFCTCHSKTTLRTSFLSGLLSSRVLFTFFGSQKRPLPRRMSWSNRQTLVWYFSHRLLLRFVPGFMKQTRLKTMLAVWWFRIKARVSIWQDPSQLKSINQTTRQYGCH